MIKTFILAGNLIRYIMHQFRFLEGFYDMHSELLGWNNFSKTILEERWSCCK